MRKLLQIFDRFGLKFGVLFTLLFTVLYPKLPSIYITHTWVYIRAEDFVIAFVVFIWCIQLLRKKVSLALPVSLPIFIYWLVGLVSLIFSIIFIGPHLANYFSKVAVLEYFRRIEYMVLFVVAFSTIKRVKDLKDYVITLCITLIATTIYGFGQHYYLNLWQIFPSFFEKYPFCFPSFQTGNEEFAKGIPLCLPSDARVTSTFGGHYDLAAFLVVVTPVLFTLMYAFKKFAAKIGLGILFLSSVTLLIFTSSRVSFVAYLIGVISALIILRQKKMIFPVVIVSVILLFTFSASTVNRFLQTFRLTTVVTNNQGQVVGFAQNSLPSSLQDKIAKNSQIIEANIPSQALPEGSGFLTLPTSNVLKTNVAVVKSSLSLKQAQELKLANGGLEISTVSGNFLMRQALVYDISFTTRFQAEWPRDFTAFTKYPILGQGIGTLTLASDNDYLRALGETGILGLISFLVIFFVFGILLKETLPHVDDPLVKTFSAGLAGGVLGLFFNASLIDVFEASKVAEPLWILLGIGAASLILFAKSVPYKNDLLKIIISKPFILLYLLIISLIIFGKSASNFFVADDFTWLHWAASATPHSLISNFYEAQNFFYRPIDKLIVFILYTIFSLQPGGYHVFGIIVHAIMAFGVYILINSIMRKRLWSFAGALLFIVLAVHAEDLFWFATISTHVSALFMIFALISYMSYRKGKSVIKYLLSLILLVFSLMSYEMAAVLPLIFIAADVLILPKEKKVKLIGLYIPVAILTASYFAIRHLAGAAGFSGDYSYSIPHFVPNFFGNVLGYFAMFVFGGSIVPWYETLRESLKTHSTIILISLIVLIALILFSFFIKKVRDSLSSIFSRQVIFAVVFSVLALFPFLGLGNIAERYAYLGSVGYVLFVILIFEKIVENVKGNATKIIVGLVLFLGLIALNINILYKEELQWQKASRITYASLGFFRIEETDILSGSNIYLVNIPIKYGNAWVFPLGLNDGLWFIYRDEAINIINFKTVSQAKDLKNSLSEDERKSTYIFNFDKNYKIEEVK